MGNKSAYRSAFSLLEISLILVIFGSIVGMSSVLGNAWIKQERVKASRLNLQTIETALNHYRKINGRLPCPADITLTASSANYGYEAYESGDTSGECYGEAGINADQLVDDDAGAATPIAASFGAVPAKTLGIAESLMRDQWGNLIVYYVSNRVTLEGSFWVAPVHTNYIEVTDTSAGLLQVNDSQGNARTQQAVYALLSHGADGHGGYQSGGGRTAGSSPRAAELENCDCNASAAPSAPDGTEDAILVQNFVSENHEDLLIYKDRRQLED